MARKKNILQKIINTEKDTEISNLLHQYSTQVEVRVRVSLFGTLAFNVVYATMQLTLGIMNHSLWFYSLAAYYLLLGFLRYFLLKEIRRDRLGKNRLFELRLYRFCGLGLFFLHIALGVVVFFIVRKNQGFTHPYIMTIGLATLTFTVLVMAIVNVIKFRKYKSPVISAAKVLSLVSAVVSLLSLETAMITAFGNGNDELLRQIVTGCTGGVICFGVLALAIYMIAVSTKEISNIKKQIRACKE